MEKKSLYNLLHVLEHVWLQVLDTTVTLLYFYKMHLCIVHIQIQVNTYEFCILYSRLLFFFKIENREQFLVTGLLKTKIFYSNWLEGWYIILKQVVSVFGKSNKSFTNRMNDFSTMVILIYETLISNNMSEVGDRKIHGAEMCWKIGQK